MNPLESVPRVFISYSHDSPEHADRVLALADRLRAEGVDCHLDQYETSPLEGWPRWMLNQVEAADFVLVICTETYNLRFRGKAEAGKGLGVKWEGAIITQELYDSEANNTSFVPVVFSAADMAHIPVPLRGATHYDPGKSGYDPLYRRLTNQPLTPKPELGKLRPMPEKQRRQDFFPPWNVPYRRNPFFTGRDQVLEDLHRALAEGPAAALTQVAAIAGLGGIGKTQTAVEYAYRHRADYNAVFWVRAESESSTTSGFLEIAGILNLAAKDAQESVQAVIRWLGNNAGWLLIFDNADEPEKLKPWVPADPKGHTLITSRAQVFHGLAKPVRLEVLAPEKALEFLLKRTEREGCDDDEKEAAAQLAKELGYLPLALEQAGAFISESGSQFRDYLASYRKQRLELLNRSKPIAGDYKESVATTWLMNFNQIEAANPASAHLLRFSAFLDPDSIPVTLIIRARAQLGPLLSAGLAGADQDPLVLDMLLQPLMSYSLIRRETGSESYSVHRMVQEAVKGRMDQTERRAWAECAVFAVNEAFPDVEYANWPLCEVLLSHAAAAARVIDEWNFGHTRAARLLSQVGFYNSERGRFAESEPLCKRAVSIYEKALGPDHPRVAISINNLAELYRIQGRYEEAEPLQRRALATREKAIGPSHPGVAGSLNNLANLYYFQGRYKEAEPLYYQALSITENALGPDHSNVAASLNNLADLCRAQGRYEEAGPLYQRALGIREKAFGPDHPKFAQSLNNLALLYDDLGRYQEAEPLYKRSLAIKENALGPDHPDVAASLSNLAALYRAWGRYEEAEPLYKRALGIREKALGPDHPDVAASLNSLAALYYSRGTYVEAEPLHGRALGIRESTLGPDHPDVATSLNNLALLYHSQGRYVEAEPLHRRALGIREKTLGPDHPDVAVSLNNLAALYADQGRHEEAETLFRRALRIREKTLGRDHPDVATSLNNLATLYADREGHEEAEPMYKRALGIGEKALGPEHPDVAVSLNNLAALYADQGRYEEAETLYKRAILVYEKALGPDHPETVNCRNNLRRFYEQQERTWPPA